MDGNILKNLVQSTTISVECTGDDEDFPAIDASLIDGLSKTFTKNLSYKVSQEAYQRYSVRLNVIDTLRNWSRLKGKIGKQPVFQDSERSNIILTRILTKYTTHDALTNCDNVDDLIQVAKSLLNSINSNKSLMKCFTRVIDRTIELEQTEKSERFLQKVIDASNDLKLDPSLIDKIFTSQKSRFIEKPLNDLFMIYCSDKEKFEQYNKMDTLFEKVVDSPTLFQCVANQLKETFVMTQYSQEAQDFIKSILAKLEIQCKKYNKDTLDLYPLNLQFCVLLLRIEPCYHTENSKDRTVQSLKEVFLRDYHDALMLISQFPKWLPEYLTFFEKLELLTQKSDLENIEMRNCS